MASTTTAVPRTWPIRHATITAAAASVAAGLVLGVTGGWSVLTAQQEIQSITHEQAALQTAIDRLDASAADSKSALIALETEQRAVESNLARIESDLGILRSKVRSAERAREECRAQESGLAAAIRTQTDALQVLIAAREARAEALVVTTRQREACDARLAEAKEAWWVTRVVR